ncbi:hypothetical protein ACS47_04415 [Bacillus cereus]|nr:hypothetical protein ACS47_04415 [Bacillus cereus]
MNIQLKVVTRENWEDALKLQVKDNQTKFVPSVAVSLAKVYIKPDGDAVEYQPFAIYNGDLMVGFVMHAVVKETTDMYWINGFIIDQKQQGNGYGKAALQESIYLIKNTPYLLNKYANGVLTFLKEISDLKIFLLFAVIAVGCYGVSWILSIRIYQNKAL